MRATQRDRVVDAYGGKCACCGETERAFLAIDHVNGGGLHERRGTGKIVGNYTIFKRIIEAGFPPTYRVLCHNCNHAMHFLGTCPHGARRPDQLVGSTDGGTPRRWP